MTGRAERGWARSLWPAILATAFALPAWANNPPRPDGVLCLVVVFPVVLVARYLAAVPARKRPLWRRIASGVLFTSAVLLAAAGTEVGLAAMLAVIVYGLTAAVGIVRHGNGAKTIALAAVVVVSTLAAGAGYLWALGAGSAAAWARASQRRTLADLRSTASAVMSWSLEQVPPAGENVPPAAARGDEAQAEASPAVVAALEEAPRSLSFDGGEAPSPISHAELQALLVPAYISDLPQFDGWNRPYELRLDREDHRFWMRSRGRDGSFESGPYVEGPFDPSDQDRDLVWVEGQLWQWPGGRGRGAASD